jgi:hypothetical protein
MAAIRQPGQPAYSTAPPPANLEGSSSSNYPAGAGVPAAGIPAPVVLDASGRNMPAVQAMKETAAAPHIQGTGDVSHTAVANELGLPTRSAQEFEAHNALEKQAQPARPQDVPTGGLVKAHDTAEVEAIDPDTKNVWSHPDAVPKEVVQGLDNEELWKLVRRFDKQMYHVKACKDGSKRGPYPELENDLFNAADEEFSPDRLRSNLERLYITFIVGSAGFIKHIARIRSWNEFNRTATWCAVYFAAWLLSQVGTLLICLLVCLMVYPPSRHYLFPPAPLSMMSASSGGLQKPPAGNTLGSKDR